MAGKDGKAPGNTYYKMEFPEGHITLMPVIFPNGDSMPPLIIINQATVDDDLEDYGLPNGDGGYILSTTTGFTSVEAHLQYVKDVVIPFFTARRKQFGLPSTARALILQDGLGVYYDETIIRNSYQMPTLTR